MGSGASHYMVSNKDLLHSMGHLCEDKQEHEEENNRKDKKDEDKRKTRGRHRNSFRELMGKK